MVNLSSFVEGRKQGRGEREACFGNFVSGPCSKESCLAGKGQGGTCRQGETVASLAQITPLIPLGSSCWLQSLGLEVGSRELSVSFAVERNSVSVDPRQEARREMRLAG